MSGIVMFVVYENPRGFPGKIVVRRWNGLEADPFPLAVEDNLEDARAVIADGAHSQGLIRMAPLPGDDPVIAEIWF